jgi:hypothetical protein
MGMLYPWKYKISPILKALPSISKAGFHLPAPVSDNQREDSWYECLFKCCGDCHDSVIQNGFLQAVSLNPP